VSFGRAGPRKRRYARVGSGRERGERRGWKWESNASVMVLELWTTRWGGCEGWMGWLLTLPYLATASNAAAGSGLSMGRTGRWMGGVGW
jgi:hypothetical protein